MSGLWLRILTTLRVRAAVCSHQTLGRKSVLLQLATGSHLLSDVVTLGHTERTIWNNMEKALPESAAGSAL